MATAEELSGSVDTGSYRIREDVVQMWMFAMSSPIFDKAVDELATLCEEGVRASPRSVKLFIEPMEGTLRRAQSKRHHVIFGRRGSGKSSPLFKTKDTLNALDFPVAYVDLEPFKGHHYPDVLISVLLDALMNFQRWLAEQESRDRRSWYSIWLMKKKKSKSHIRSELDNLLEAKIAALRSELHLPDQAQLVQTLKSDLEATRQKRRQTGANTNVHAFASSVEAETASGVRSSLGQETQETFRRSKIDLLHRSILDYHRIFNYFSELTAGDCFLILDDLYHIARTDQPRMLDYFHRIAKGHNLWLKVGTIKHRSTLVSALSSTNGAEDWRRRR